MGAKLLLVCEECGGEFQRYPSQMKKSQRPYCSLSCVGKAKRHGSVIQCAWCDSSTYRRFGEQAPETVNQFCSKACYGEYRRAHASPTTYLKGEGGRHLHRIVAEKCLGRPLLPDEVVHHIDMDKHNNDPSNLAVFPDQAAHGRCHKGGMSDDELRRFSL